MKEVKLVYQQTENYFINYIFLEFISLKKTCEKIINLHYAVSSSSGVENDLHLDTSTIAQYRHAR